MSPWGRIGNVSGVEVGMLAVCLFAALSIGSAEGAELRVVSPSPGEPLRRDQLELDLQVAGEPLTTYAVHINGAQDTVVVLTDEAGVGRGGATVDVLPLRRTVAGSGDVDPVVAEQHFRVLQLDVWGPVDGVWAQEPLDRQRVTLVDLRDWESDAEPLLEPDEVLVDGLAVGLTAEGLAQLEAPLVAELPAAPLRAFDSLLAEVVGDGVAAGGADLPPGTCVPLDELPFALQAWLAPEIAATLGAAATVPACKRALDVSAVGAWQAAVVAHGYELRPTLGTRADLAVCVEGLDATLVDLWTAGHAVGLSTADDGVEAEAWHLAPRGRVDVALDAWLVYKDGVYEEGPCGVVQPLAVPEEQATCRELPVSAEVAGGSSVGLGLGPDPVGFGLVSEQQDASESALWDAWLDPEADALCGHPVLAEPVAALVASVGSTAAALLDSAWDAGLPDPTQLSAGLESLLASWELSSADEEAEAVAVEAELTELVELRADPTDWEAPQGLVAFYDTAAEPLEPWDLNGLPVYAPEAVPWPDTGVSWWGTPIDARIAVSVGAVNQVWAAAAMTDVLARPVALTEFSGVEVEAALRWTLPPVLTMVPGDVEGDDPLLLDIASLELVLHEPADPSVELAVFWIDAVDPAFELLLGETDGALEADAALERLRLTLARHALPVRPSEDGLADQLGPAIEAAVLAGLDEALSLLPVPEFQGLVAPVEVVEVEAPYQSGDVVLFSVGLRPSQAVLSGHTPGQ